jgi:hypothetical protein
VRESSLVPSSDRVSLRNHLQSAAFDPTGDVAAQLAALHAHDAPVVLTVDEITVLQAKVTSVNKRDADQGKAGLPLTLAEAIALCEDSYLRCSATGVRGVLRQGALLQLSIDAIDCTRSHSADNVQLMLTHMNYAKNCTPDAAFRNWAAGAFK